MVTQAYRDLMAAPLEAAERPIPPLVSNRHEGHPEYGDEIADFSIKIAKHTNRYVPPYDCKAVHGDNVYTFVRDRLLRNDCWPLLDLGCGSGGLLLELRAQGIPKNELYGCTIHLGECKRGREAGLSNVAPIDMRDLWTYFEPDTFGCVVTFWGMNHIGYEDRTWVLHQSYKILRPGGYFIGLDYGSDPKTRIPMEGIFEEEAFENTVQGGFYQFQKAPNG